jgi:hypothetical protein
MPRPPSRRARISAQVMLRTRRRTRALPATCQQRRLLWPRVPSACLNLPGCLAGATKWKRRRRRHTWDRGEVFTRQKSQVRSLSRPPAKMLPTLAPAGRLPEDLPEDHRQESSTLGQRGSIRPVGGPATVGRGAAAAGMQLASLEDPIALVQFRWGDRFRDLKGERQPCVDRLDDPSGHLWGGVPVAGANAATTLEFPAAAALVPMSSSITQAGMPASSSQVEKLCRRSCGPRSCRCARSLWAR